MLSGGAVDESVEALEDAIEGRIWSTELFSAWFDDGDDDGDDAEFEAFVAKS